MINPFRKGILYGSIVSALGAIFGIVIIFVLITAYTTAKDTQRYFDDHLKELLDTVESTVSVACFVEDKQLAAELVAGLLKNNGVASVVIRADSKQILAHGFIDYHPLKYKIPVGVDKDKTGFLITVIGDDKYFRVMDTDGFVLHRFCFVNGLLP